VTGTRIAVTVAVAIAVAAGLAVSYPAGGPRGLVIAGTCLAVLALLIALAAIPRGSARPRARRGRGRAPGVRAADFPSCRKIAADLGWAAVSMRHYDHTTRPLLSRLLAAALEERYRLDPDRAPGQARRLVGDDLWPLVDPARRPSDDSNAPGVDLPTLARIVTRLEEL
jgi:hypothetical protein